MPFPNLMKSMQDTILFPFHESNGGKSPVPLSFKFGS